jgi:uncharacterized BrkB/YihY/UPF0761 family membrane protein
LSTATEQQARVGHPPASPEKLSVSEWLEAVRRSFSAFIKDDCIGLSQQIAYSSLLAFFPAVAFVVGALGLFGAELNSELERQADIHAAGGERAGLVRLARRS